jgi:hypothetical protein
MKLSGAIIAAGAVALSAAGAMLGVSGSTGCSSSSSSSSGGGSSSGSGSNDSCSNLPPGACNVWPKQGSGSPTTAKHNYAISKLYLGNYTRTGQHDTMTGWQNFGYNLDGLVTTRTSTDVCTLAAGAGHDVQVDGPEGIDNSFGENILPIVTSFNDVDMTVNTTIAAGHFTVMAYVTGLDDSNPMQTATGLSGVLLPGADYAGLNEGGAPAFNMTTNWPAAPNTLACASAGCTGQDPVANATVKFPMAYVTNGTFVNGSPSDVQLSLGIGGQMLNVTAHAAIMTFQVTAPGTVKNGTIAGVIKTDELLTAVQGIAGHISHSLCDMSAFNSIATAIKAAADIILNADGSIANMPGQACSGISIGIGFDATEIAAPTVIAPPAAPSPDPCADAGSE